MRLLKKYSLLIALIVIILFPSFVFSEDDFADGSLYDQAETSASDRMQELEAKQKELFKEIERLNQIAEVRQRLEMTEEEREDQGKEILSAAGQEYTMRKKGTWGLDYSFSYSYKASDAILFESIEDAAAATTTVNASVEGFSNHSISNNISSQFAIYDNLTASINLPFVYKYDNGGASKAADITDLGDISVGCQWQPFKVNRFATAPIMSFSLSVPTGTSPYNTSHDNYMSTGAGMYSLTTSTALSKTFDPVMIYGNLAYTVTYMDGGVSQNRDGGQVLTEVDPGNSTGFAMGVGYALSYKVSMNISTSYSFSQSTTYKWRNISDPANITTSTQKSGTSASGKLNIGWGLRYSPKNTLNITTGFGLTNSASDFSISLRLPFVF